MKTFEDLKFELGFDGGIVGKIELENGAEISVAMTKSTYGGIQGLWEICVFKSKTGVDSFTMNCFEGKNALGWLTTKEVSEKIVEVQKELNLIDKNETTKTIIKKVFNDELMRFVFRVERKDFRNENNYSVISELAWDYIAGNATSADFDKFEFAENFVKKLNETLTCFI